MTSYFETWLWHYSISVRRFYELALVETHDTGHLSRHSRDVHACNGLGLCHSGQSVGNELVAVVQTNRQRRTPNLDQFIKASDDPSRRYADLNLNAQGRLVEFMDHV